MRPAHPSIERARKIATLLDSSITIPVIRKKIGIDPLLGLFPVGGDAISALMGAYLLYVAYKLRLPKAIMIRMGLNVIVDSLIGTIPVVGDVADAFWKSNQWNFKILEEAYQKHGAGVESTPGSQSIVDVVAEPVR